MCSLFSNLAIIDDDDVIRISDGGQSMRDDKTGPSFHQAQQRFLDAGLRAGIYTGSGFIRYQFSSVTAFFLGKANEKARGNTTRGSTCQQIIVAGKLWD